MPSKALDPELYDMTALASVLKNSRARKTFEAALKKGQSPVLSLTAAISASLVTAAAKEEGPDPLAGRAAVDDLTAFTELCDPKTLYADGAYDHEAPSGREDHADHHGGASYLADPFASRFANIYARDHGGHHGHDGHEAITLGHAHDGDADIQDGGPAAMHAAHADHQQGHQGHRAHEPGGGGHEGTDHASGRHPNVGAARHASHDPHASGRDMTGHDGAGHQVSHAVHASHAPLTPDAPHTDHASMHEDHAAASASDNDVIDLDQSIDALAQDHRDEHEAASGEASGAAEDHHHRGVTLADLDVLPVEDLAAAPPPVI